MRRTTARVTTTADRKMLTRTILVMPATTAPMIITRFRRIETETVSGMSVMPALTIRTMIWTKTVSAAILIIALKRIIPTRSNQIRTGLEMPVITVRTLKMRARKMPTRTVRAMSVRQSAVLLTEYGRYIRALTVRMN